MAVNVLIDSGSTEVCRVDSFFFAVYSVKKFMEKKLESAFTFMPENSAMPFSSQVLMNNSTSLKTS